MCMPSGIIQKRTLFSAYLDALLELVSGCGRSFPEQLTEDDDLLKEENSSFLRA